jgi:predicted nucleotidyltransferase
VRTKLRENFGGGCCPMQLLSDQQLLDLKQLGDIAAKFAADLAIIGASALRCGFDPDRFTEDVDFGVALDLEDFATFAEGLKSRGWAQETKREHRWHGPNGSMIDLMPAGPKLRTAQQIIWPVSRCVMSLVGFGHVFVRSIPFEFAPGIQFPVAPLPVIALLKIVSFSESPNLRERDLDDLKSLLRRYENDTDRIFGDEIFAANLEDVEFANAVLLGLDIGAITTHDEAEVVHEFLRKQRMPIEDVADLDREHSRQEEEWRFQMQLAAFEIGFERNFKARSS